MPSPQSSPRSPQFAGNWPFAAPSKLSQIATPAFAQLGLDVPPAPLELEPDDELAAPPEPVELELVDVAPDELDGLVPLELAELDPPVPVDEELPPHEAASQANSIDDAASAAAFMAAILSATAALWEAPIALAPLHTWLASLDFTSFH